MDWLVGEVKDYVVSLQDRKQEDEKLYEKPTPFRIEDTELKAKDNALATISRKMTRVNKQIASIRWVLANSY